MCNIEIKDGIPSKDVKERLGSRGHNLGTTAKQVAMVGSCVVKRRY